MSMPASALRPTVSTARALRVAVPIAVLLAVAVNGNQTNPEVRVVPYRVNN